MATGRIEDLLMRVPLFEDLGPPTIERIGARAQAVEVRRREVVFRQGDPCFGLHILTEGQLKLALDTVGGGETVLEVLGPGATCGEASVFLGRPHLAFAEALCDSKLLRIPSDVLREQVRQGGRFAERVIAQVCQRLYRRTLDFGSHMTLSGTQRVIAYLLSEGPTDFDGKPVTLRLRAKKGLIASRLNLTPAHFSRILHELVEAELIDVNGGTVRIHDVRRLQGYGAD